MTEPGSKNSAGPSGATERPLLKIVAAIRTLEGGGFPVRRPFPTAQLDHVDPFLLIDEMGPVDWPPGEAMGAPDHPHRGFETVTYVLQGRHQHKDSAGNAGMLGPGDVQWMTAGAGVVHSEMPEDEFRRTGGVMHGFQIWVNLPAKHKMMKPRYQEVPGAGIPTGETPDGKARVRVIAGSALGAEAVIDTVTPIMLMHFTLQPGGAVRQPVPANHNAMAYVFSGEARLGPESAPAAEGTLGVYGAGDTALLANGEDAAVPAEVLLLTGAPLEEPVARHGPFVMNTREEILQAFQDYQEGRMGQIEG
jgi:hypothetical protein